MMLVFPRRWISLGVSSYTLGMGDTVRIRTAVVIWLLIPFASTFVVKSMYKTLRGKGKIVLSPRVTKSQFYMSSCS